MPRPTSAPRRPRSRDDFAPDSLALALVNAAAMGLVDELEREATLRRSRHRARGRRSASERGGADRLHADVAGAAYGGAVLAAAGRVGARRRGRAPTSSGFCASPIAAAAASLRPLSEQCGSCASSCTRPSSTRRSRFYRDELGLPQREAYEGEGDARVVILRGRRGDPRARQRRAGRHDRPGRDGRRDERPDPHRVRGRATPRPTVERLAAAGAAGRGIRPRDAVAVAQRSPARRRPACSSPCSRSSDER